MTGPSSDELGPFTREELRAALDDGVIDRLDQVRTPAGKKLGAVSALLRISSAREPLISGFLRRQPRSTVITVIALAVILVPLVGMLIALRATALPVQPGPEAQRPVGAERAAQPEAPSPPPSSAPAPAAAVEPAPPPAELGMHSGTVASILSKQDLILALGATQSGGANHKVDILNGEIAHNAFDGNLGSKYYNPTHDGPRPGGVASGFAITPRAAGVVTAFQFATANDVEGRDPLAITIEGSDADNAGKDQGGGFTLIYSGPSGLEADPGRLHWGLCVVFANRTAYRTYRVLVARIRDDNANGTQYSEFRLGTFSAGAAPGAR